jgi:hypothetical protein
MPTTNVNVFDNIAGVDMGTQDVYKVWNKDVPDDVGDVVQINNDVEVTKKLALIGVTTTK